MIYAIAALDSKKGLANDNGIPWKLPADQAQFRAKTKGYPIVFGFGMYSEMQQPLPDRRNIVLVRPDTPPLREGFEACHDVNALLDQYQDSEEVIWVVGGAKVFETTLPRLQKLYLTRIDKDFACTKFFPDFEDQFNCVEQGSDQHQNGLTFRYEIWDSQPKLK